MTVTSAIVQTIILPWLQAAVLALLPVLGTFVVAILRKRGVDVRWFEAIGRAGGASYAALLASGRPASDPAAIHTATWAGAKYLLERVPDLVAARGHTVETLMQVSGAQLGVLLASDPGVAPKP